MVALWLDTCAMGRPWLRNPLVGRPSSPPWRRRDLGRSGGRSSQPEATRNLVTNGTGIKAGVPWGPGGKRRGLRRTGKGAAGIDGLDWATKFKR